MVVPVVKPVVKGDPLDALVEPAVLVDDVETTEPLDDPVWEVIDVEETPEALDDPVWEVIDVEVTPVEPVPTVVVDVRPVVPATFYSMRCTNSN